MQIFCGVSKSIILYTSLGLECLPRVTAKRNRKISFVRHNTEEGQSGYVWNFRNAMFKRPCKKMFNLSVYILHFCYNNREYLLIYYGLSDGKFVVAKPKFLIGTIDAQSTLA